MSPPSFPGTDLGAVNHTSVRMRGPECGPEKESRWDGRGGLLGYLEQQDCAASQGLQLRVTLPDSPATLVSWAIWSGPRDKKEKGKEKVGEGVLAQCNSLWANLGLLTSSVFWLCG